MVELFDNELNIDKYKHPLNLAMVAILRDAFVIMEIYSKDAVTSCFSNHQAPFVT